MAHQRGRIGSGRTAVALQRLGALRRYILGRAHLVWPPVGMVRLGGLRRLTPISRRRGADRGTPIDRYYIRHFLARHAGQDGYVVGDDTYTRMFGSGVTRVDILHGDASNRRATLVADLARADQLPAETYDCVICTQTLLLIYDVRTALANLARALRPGGVLFVTVPGISHICRPDAD